MPRLGELVPAAATHVVARAAPGLADGLAVAELAAIRLDGEAAELGGRLVTVDALESPALRAAIALDGRSSRLVADRGTAAWIWGARSRAPEPGEYCVDITARTARRAVTAERRVREVVLPSDDVIALGEVRVTTPLRTAIDLIRLAPAIEPPLARTIGVLAAGGRQAPGFELADAAAALGDRLHLPGRRRTLEALRSILGEVPPGESFPGESAQPPLTR